MNYVRFEPTTSANQGFHIIHYFYQRVRASEGITTKRFHAIYHDI
jgi:hypothetical protein